MSNYKKYEGNSDQFGGSLVCLGIQVYNHCCLEDIGYFFNSKVLHTHQAPRKLGSYLNSFYVTPRVDKCYSQNP